MWWNLVSNHFAQCLYCIKLINFQYTLSSYGVTNWDCVSAKIVVGKKGRDNYEREKVEADRIKESGKLIISVSSVEHGLQWLKWIISLSPLITFISYQSTPHITWLFQ